MNCTVNPSAFFLFCYEERERERERETESGRMEGVRVFDGVNLRVLGTSFLTENSPLLLSHKKQELLKLIYFQTF